MPKTLAIDINTPILTFEEGQVLFPEVITVKDPTGNSPDMNYSNIASNQFEIQFAHSDSE